jgi:L-fucose isomerase-like protein
MLTKTLGGLATLLGLLRSIHPDLNASFPRSFNSGWLTVTRVLFLVLIYVLMYSSDCHLRLLFCHRLNSPKTCRKKPTGSLLELSIFVNLLTTFGHRTVLFGPINETTLFTVTQPAYHKTSRQRAGSLLALKNEAAMSGTSHFLFSIHSSDPNTTVKNMNEKMSRISYEVRIFHSNFT